MIALNSILLIYHLKANFALLNLIILSTYHILISLHSMLHKFLIIISFLYNDLIEIDIIFI